MGRTDSSQISAICIIYVILQLFCAVQSFTVNIPQTEKFKIRVPVSLKIEGLPHINNQTSHLRNSSESQPSSVPVSFSSESSVPLLLNIPIKFPLPSLLKEDGAGFQFDPDDSFTQDDPEIETEEEDFVGASLTASDPIKLNKTVIGALGNNEDLKLFLAPAAMQAASKLFTYALGMNMTANKGRKPNCECGRRRLDGVYPYVDRSLRKSDGAGGSQKISGGIEAIPNEFPWRVALQGSPGGVFCGGSIIDNGWIVTAASCLHELDPTTPIYVNAGDHDISTVTETDNVVIRAASWVIHPYFNPYTFDNNIALIRLQRDLIFRDNIQAICLPYKLADDDLVGATAVTGGWGPQREYGPSSRVLRRVDLPVLSAHQIRDMTRELITDNMIGTMMAGRDVCNGDLGGTLDFFDLESGRYQAIGIASHGEGCARVNTPRVYTKMTNYLDYIHTTTRAAFCVK